MCQIATVPNRNSPPAILLRESYRENGKVKSRTLANLSMQPDHAIDALRQSLKGERLIACRNPPLAVRRAAKRQSMLEGHSH